MYSLTHTNMASTNMEQNSNVEVQNDEVDELIKEIKYAYKIYKRAAAQVNILDDKMDAVEIRMKRAIEGRIHGVEISRFFLKGGSEKGSSQKGV